MILESHEFKRELLASIAQVDSSMVVLSAFIKKRALAHSEFSGPLTTKSVTIVARWQKHDLISGASDLAVYEFCRANGWRFGIDLNLHGKLFLLDSKDIFLGSANLTQKGLHIGLTGNNEFGTKMSAGGADIDKIHSFIDSEVTWMDDDLYSHIVNEIEESRLSKVPALSSPWSKFIADRVNKPVNFLWVQELVFTTPSELLRLDLEDEKVAHDFDLLGLNLDEVNEASIKRSFRRLRIFRWMCTVLSAESLSFGGVTAKLHSAILDDPKPYRVDIKNYNQIIFQWAEFIDDTFDVSRPNYSQVLSLKSE